jgi:RNA recognition motif-containing protein
MLEEDIRQFFSSHSLNLVRVKLLLNASGASKGSGILEFENAKDADTAFQTLNGIEYDASKRKLILEQAEASVF